MSPAPVTLRSAAVAFGAFALIVGSVGLLSHFRGGAGAHAALAGEGDVDPVAMKLAPQTAAPAPFAPPFTGLDLTRAVIGDNEAVVSLPSKRVAHLTLDLRLQKFAIATLKQHKLSQAAIVMMDPDTGAILAYASRADNRPHDLAIEATAPSASVFKL